MKLVIIYFNPRSPWGERLYTFIAPRRPCGISIHALREESDINGISCKYRQARFQSTLSVRRATLLDLKDNIIKVISIHALREESDCKRPPLQVPLLDFNPRSPWGERHTLCVSCTELTKISIHALREESDSIARAITKKANDFNPRSPWGERRKSPGL